MGNPLGPVLDQLSLDRDIFSEEIGYRKEPKNLFTDSHEDADMTRDNAALNGLTNALKTALRNDNKEMIRIWANQRDALLRNMRWTTVKNQLAGTEHVSSTI